MASTMSGLRLDCLHRRDEVPKIGFRSETGLEVEGQIRVYPSRMERAVLAIVDNAAEYGPDGGLVSLTSSTDRDELRIVVADEGPGAPREEPERVFERFHKVGGSRGAEGSGLGLSIAKQMVELRGGGSRRTPRPAAEPRSRVEART